MDPILATLPDTQTIAQLVGSACGRRTFTPAEAQVLEWALVQVALDGSGPVNEVVHSYRSSLLAGADWHAAFAAALLQTPRQWGAEIQAALSAFEEIRTYYRNSDIAVFLFADKLISEHAAQTPPFPGYVPLSAPEDPRPRRLVELADQADVAGETLELAKVLQDRFPHILRRGFKLSFSGALGALFCDLDIEADRVPRLLTVAALVSVIFKPVRLI